MKPLAAFEPQVNPSFVIGGSIIGNVFLWFALGQGSNQPVYISRPPELVFERVTMEKQPNAAKPIFHPVPPKPPAKKPEPKPTHVKPPPPEGAHNRIVSANTPSKASSDDHFVVPSGGNATLGKPTSGQGLGSGVVNPPAPPPQPPPPAPPVPAKTNDAPRPVTAPPPVGPKHEDPPPVTPPPPPPPVKPKGPTREAAPDHQENVEIPERLKTQAFKSFVRVRVTIAADGTFTVTLRTSSGNSDVDKLVLDTLNKWTWKPALRDGDAVDSVQQFRFNFTIE